MGFCLLGLSCTRRFLGFIPPPHGLGLFLELLEEGCGLLLDGLELSVNGDVGVHFHNHDLDDV